MEYLEAREKVKKFLAEGDDTLHMAIVDAVFDALTRTPTKVDELKVGGADDLWTRGLVADYLVSPAD